MKNLLILIATAIVMAGCVNGNLNLRDASATVISDTTGTCRVQLVLTEPQAAIVIPLPEQVCQYIPPGVYTVGVDTITPPPPKPEQKE